MQYVSCQATQYLHMSTAFVQYHLVYITPDIVTRE